MKIKNIEINSFRGIPKNANISFADNKGKPVSTIIYGDNGSGKSTIVDAIEFCLQGRIERSQVLNNPKRPSPLSYSKKILCGAETQITFKDDSTFNRSINVIHKDSAFELQMDNKYMHDKYNIVPIVLRRNDIISFNIIPADKRQVLFFSFLYDGRKKAEDILESDCFTEDDPYIISLSEQYTELKHNRASYIESFKKLIGDVLDKYLYSQNGKLEQLFNSKFCTINTKRVTKHGVEAKKFLSKSKYDLAKSLTIKIGECSDRISQIKKDIEYHQNPNHDGLRDRKNSNKVFLDEASKYLSESFKNVSNVDYVEDIRLSVGDWTSASLDIRVKLKSKKTVSPNNIFSEANYDLLILLLYLSIIRVGADHGQEKVIILDDVLQSVDSTIRLNFLNYLLKNFKDWQIILTAHDKLWLNQAKIEFQRNGHPVKLIRVYDWNFENGPKIIYEDNKIYDDTLEKAINMNENIMMASMSGRILELICNQLSYSMSLGIDRKIGDKYTLGDLWPPLKSKLKNTELKELMENVDKLLVIRNLLGCHYNEWAESLSESEIKTFANNVKELYERTFCRKCCTWIKYINKSGIIAECTCHDLQYCKIN